MKRVLLALAIAALSACATATPYQSAEAPKSGAYGYAERKIEDNRYRVSFRGNALTERDVVESYLLFRAAELTLEQGYDYFIAATRATDDRSEIRSFGAPSAFGFYPSYSLFSPRYGWRPYYDPFWDDVTFREVTRYEATAEIVLYKGAKPANDPNAYDARQVRDNLAGKVVRPPAG